MSMAARLADVLTRRSRKAIRRRQPMMHLESLEPRLALASGWGLALPNIAALGSSAPIGEVRGAVADTSAPFVRSVSVPAAGTYATGRMLTFRLDFSERVYVDDPAVSLPVEVGFAMREARYAFGSGTSSLTFRMEVKANDVDTDGISLGRVSATSAVRDFDFATSEIRDAAGNSASSTIPTVNTSRVRVQATGPIVTGSRGFVTRGQQVSLRVNFADAVQVTGVPTVPVTIGGVDRELRYVSGSGTSMLTFAVNVPRGASVASPSFRSSIGEVILLPVGANLRDRQGNSVTPIGGDFGKPYADDNDNRVVVIGAHYESLGTVTRETLNDVLTTERDVFNPASDSSTPKYWKNYTNPSYPMPANTVDLYRVAYRSTIPEQGNRPTIAYGLVAIPSGATGRLPVVSVQHGTLWLKESAPSQAFSWDKNSTAVVNYGLTEQELYYYAYETRLNVAQFAGNGYVVIAADYFGIGNSIENDSFFVKKSAQQACLDMYSASLKLLQSKGLPTTNLDLFLNGWSQGGIVSLAFQEALEARGVRIAGVSTAAATNDTGMFAERFIFNRRPYSQETVPDAAWSIFIHQFSSFSLAGYSGQTNAPLELLGKNYEISRKFYMREFAAMPWFYWNNSTPVMKMDGVEYNAEVPKFLDPKVAASPRAYESTAYASLIRSASSGMTRLDSDMKMYYGEQDEGYTSAVCTIVDTWQRGTFGKTNIEQVGVPYASHRSVFLTAVAGQLSWFNSKRTLA